MSAQSVCRPCRTQPAPRPRAGGRLGCFVVAATLAWGGWHASSKDGADSIAFSAKSKEAVFEESVISGVEKVLPGAMPSSDALPAVLSALEPYDVNADNAIYGTSVSPDELSNAKDQLQVLLAEHFGTVFPMGGLGGVPFVGKAGFEAFSAHVPDDGNVMVMFGPQIGFSPSAEAGKFLRPGQAKVSPACAALTAAYNEIASGSVSGDPQDMEQEELRARMASHFVAANKADCPMVEFVMGAYKEIEKEIMAIVNTDFGAGNLILLGGININLPAPLPGYFLPLHFSARSASSGPTDLMSAFA